MDTETGLLVGGFAVLAVGAAFMLWMRALSKRDRQVFRQMEPIMEELLRPLRFLADLRSVWPDLSEEQRLEIENSSTYREGFHEDIARSQMQKLDELARRIRSLRHWRIRKAVLEFVRHWETQEPDSLKVILAMVKREAAA